MHIPATGTRTESTPQGTGWVVVQIEYSPFALSVALVAGEVETQATLDSSLRRYAQSLPRLIRGRTEFNARRKTMQR